MTHQELNEIKKRMTGKQQDTGSNKTAPNRKLDGDYIDYEEIK